MADSLVGFIYKAALSNLLRRLLHGLRTTNHEWQRADGNKFLPCLDKKGFIR